VRLRAFVGLVGLLPTLLFAQSGSQIAATPGTISATIDRNKVKLVQHLGSQVPLDATFRDRAGKTVDFRTLLGNKPSILLPIFYRCKGVCGLELQGTIAALKNLKTRKLGQGYNIIVMSIHPKETPDLAQGKYQSTVDEVALPGTESGWRFVVGDWKNIHKVTDTVGFNYTYDEPLDAINHPSGIVFLSPKGVVSSYIYGAAYKAHDFERNIDFAGREAVGARVEEIFFGCVHVDPLTGQRSIQIQNVIKVAGVATILGIAMLILVSSGKAKFRRSRQG
jgi:protein SCO1